MRRNAPHKTRTAVRRGAVATTTVAAVLAVSGQSTVSAVPVAADRAVSADREAQAAGIGTTETQRVDAAAAVGLDPTVDVLLLSDSDFIHALWRKANEAGERLDSVRTAAEKAMASTMDADHVAFIVTGIHEAHRLDQQRERDKAEAERAARLARQQALLAIGIPSTPELLGLSDDNFIRAILRHEASGPEVRAAATQALLADEAAWREFIVNGAREAHKKDVARELEELEEKNRKEAELRRNQAARKNVAALFRIPVTQSLLDTSDDNFIREMLRMAPSDLKDSELYRAAQKAVLSTRASDWLDFLHTGADAAYKRDDEARREKLAEANRMLARQILDTAKKSPFNPNLVTSAEKALAAGDVQVAEFLSEAGQRRARRQSLSLRVQNSPEKWLPVHHSGVNGTAATVGPVSPQNVPLRGAATWLVLPALSGRAGCFSFEAASKSGHYLKATTDQGLVVLGANDNTKAFRDSTTWCPDLQGWVPGRSATAWFLWEGGKDHYQVKVNARNELFTSGRFADWHDLLTAYPAWEVTPPLAP
ncbi:AbfB domain-containing protein [Streptomyces sp. NPDC029080]|uniref:AbfB domain-containing protein n=1 Tax=Streptomyces sp. NPDC029080 TaxID=3155017 RepID=UPI0033E67F12